MSEILQLNRACPDCLKSSVALQSSRVFCTEDGCSFKVEYGCPLCSASLDDSMLETTEKGDRFVCGQCTCKVSLKKIKSLIDNGMYVDYDHRCSICNGPTLHRPEMNLSHRCFYYPSCSGQGDLFVTEKASYTFLDFETTGLEVGKHEIIEIGALKIDPDGDEHILQLFIKPEGDIPEQITKITGITNEMVEDAPPITEGIQQLMDFIGTSKVVAHNAEFDVPWLVVSCLKEKLSIPDTEVICTLKWSRASGETRNSLGALTKKYAIGHANAHRALADAAATRELFFIFENMNKAPRPAFQLSEFIPMGEKIVQKYDRVLNG